VRHAILLIVVALIAAALAAAGAEAGEKAAHVRCLSSSCQRLLQAATERSPVIRGFLEDLERSDVTVYVDLPGSIAASQPRSWIRFVSAAAGVRYLLVQIDPWRAPFHEQIALLGHELYHALEIAAAPDVTDVPSLRRLYARIGHQWGVTRYETDQAQVAERLVRADLNGGARLVAAVPGYTGEDLLAEGWDAAGREGLVRPRSLDPAWASTRRSRR